MNYNLRKRKDDQGELYVNVADLLKMLVDVMQIEGMHPEHIRALDGFGVGLAIILDAVDLQDLPESVREYLDKKGN